MRTVRQTIEVARQTLLLQLRGRLALLLGIAIAGAAAIAVLVSTKGGPHVPGDQLHGMFTYGLVFAFAVPFAVLYLGVAAIHGDIEDRTATYLFVLPLRRWSLLLGKWLAVIALSWTAAAIVLIVVYAIFALRTDYQQGIQPRAAMLGVFLQAAALAVPPYAAVGVLCASLFKRPLVTGVAYLLISDGVLSNLPPQAGVRSATVADPIRRWLLEHLEARGELREMLVGSLEPFLEDIDVTKMSDPASTLLKFTIVVLGLALLVYSRREYDSRPRE
jgi:hypothetical protein